ncbi:MAG: phage tail protein [Alteromonadaceae bacterium]|nr:phage tail protein [Alteromonadaceae bacterium]
MATTIADIENDYPIPVYRFRVSITGDESNSIAFSEVSGLDIGVDTITYKDGFGTKHMPGQPTEVNITLKRGLVRTKSMFYDWISAIRLNKVDKQDITVVLVDDNDADLVIWTVKNAFPKKLTAPSFNGGSNEASVESLELMADDISVEFK